MTSHIQHPSATNIHSNSLRNVIPHCIDAMIEVRQAHTNDKSNTNLDQRRIQLHLVDMCNCLYPCVYSMLLLLMLL